MNQKLIFMHLIVIDLFVKKKNEKWLKNFPSPTTVKHWEGNFVAWACFKADGAEIYINWNSNKLKKVCKNLDTKLACSATNFKKRSILYNCGINSTWTVSIFWIFLKKFYYKNILWKKGHRCHELLT